MTLLILAHVAAALIAVIVLVAAIAVVGFVGGVKVIKPVVARSLIATAAVLVLLSPLFVTLVRFGQDFNPVGKLTRHQFAATQNFISTSRYFYDSGHEWQVGYATLNALLQIDLALWIAIVLGVAILAVALVARGGKINLGPYFNVPAMVFVLVSLAIFVFLQLPMSKFVYDAIHPLDQLQFPWRMLGFITPLAIIAVIAMAEAGCRRFNVIAVKSASLVWLGSIVALSPVFVALPAAAFQPTSQLLSHEHAQYRQLGLMIGINGEYLPVIKRHTDLQTLAYYQYLHATDREAQAVSLTPCDVTQLTTILFRSDNEVQTTVACDQTGTRCTVSEPGSTRFEALHFQLTVSCNRPTDLALPITVNDYTSISAIGPGGRPRPVVRVRDPTDPRIVIRVTSTRPEALSIDLPTLGRVLF
jgi:hypothetical protein